METIAHGVEPCAAVVHFALPLSMSSVKEVGVTGSAVVVNVDVPLTDSLLELSLDFISLLLQDKSYVVYSLLMVTYSSDRSHPHAVAAACPMFRDTFILALPVRCQMDFIFSLSK